MILYLIGMPGCGKSTLGKRLANELGYDFIDMDNYIEKNACMFIDEIFDSYGEKFFRDLETKTLEELSKLDNVVIATGGGVIKNKKHKSLMKGKCIYLYVPIEQIAERLNNSTTIRPLLQKYTPYQLYEERKDLYEYFQDITVDNTNIDKAILSIKEAL